MTDIEEAIAANSMEQAAVLALVSIAASLEKILEILQNDNT
jgi:hypothetical protein